MPGAPSLISGQGPHSLFHDLTRNEYQTLVVRDIREIEFPLGKCATLDYEVTVPVPEHPRTSLEQAPVKSGDLFEPSLPTYVRHGARKELE